ncbi:MAG: magnesium transporter CorA family protein [Pseudomonadales bacterium]|nr:magnesium transporter CorA family protein [Pseudomonadales bacterium]
MRRCILFSRATGRITVGGDELIQQWQGSDDYLWLDILRDNADAEKILLTETFGIHTMAIQDAHRERHPPKYEAFSGYYLLLLKGLSPGSTETSFDTIQIAMFVGENFLITTHEEESRSINTLWDAVIEKPVLMEKGPRVLPAMIARNIVNRYLSMLMKVEIHLDELEQLMLQNDPTNEQLAQLTTYKTRLRIMQRVFSYHEQIFLALRADPDVTQNDFLQHEFNDAYEHLERADSLARLYYDLANDLINSSISLASHRLNGIMKILTIITAIFVPLGFLAGLYGMNFEYIPELQIRNGYFYLLGAMSTIATGLLVIFRVRKWL